jgi:hypothetical protein
MWGFVRGILFLIILITCVFSDAGATPFSWEKADPKPLAFKNCEKAREAYLSSVKPHRRQKIIQTLDTIPQEFCWELLIEALNDSNFFVRQDVHIFILELPKEEQVDFVRQALSREKEQGVLSTIQLVSKLPESIQSEFGTVISNLIRFTPHDTIRIEAYSYLMKRDPGLLKPILQDVNPAISKLALYFLQHQQPQNKESKALIQWAANERPDLYSDLARQHEMEQMLTEWVAPPQSKQGWRRVLLWFQSTAESIWHWVKG